ncbi:MAG: polyisoprenoid-binding protein [Pseudonocardia sp.]|nr:polyisoprenoid-binding protein [Pseudonocardia sp.]MBO0873635.1 polyisoprenoid-binding protein [Pseudonocardia sp.]
MSTTEAVGLTAGTWDIDPVHSDVSFAVRHLMVSKIRGRFGSFSGSIVTDPDVAGSSVTASIDLASVDTGNEQRDQHVRAAQWLDTDNHPTMTYRSTAVRRDGDGLVVDGELTLRGVTRSVPLTVELGGTGPDPWGGTRIGFSAAAAIDRRDFGIDVSVPIDGGVVVSDRVQIQLEVEAVLRAE